MSEPELPPLPTITLELVEDRSPRSADGFLSLRRHVLRAVHADGTRSEPFIYDSLERRALDAVVIAPWYRDDSGQPIVVLRSAVRPPVLNRGGSPVEEPGGAGLWELPAGLVEAGERSASGVRAAAARELLEETGYDVPPEQMHELGTSAFPAPALIGERHFFFAVEVDPETRGAPTLDGSALEVGAQLAEVPLADALELCRAGAIPDEKTELALRRLADRLFLQAPLAVDRYRL